MSNEAVKHTPDAETMTTEAIEREIITATGERYSALAAEWNLRGQPRQFLSMFM